ncbi:PREDICTED: MAM domain-containing glycosylphosphatidylinositol anchor protein 1-like [Ceratosolen solmsi marchali]|uniref:MAM domain-containing glycosylphosphatidylinositol anchor protein 1-like n=1 Tax=Ceratosolen solmsi marchali TaxID=326594 RepID=A0AAJ6YUP1_9HYME|nr:PREDICTED: MAM domain-containing glycosylphosphatidylinositol anchor protein 1-like [Ceratosolen solmsi marchali]
MDALTKEKADLVQELEDAEQRGSNIRVDKDALEAEMDELEWQLHKLKKGLELEASAKRTTTPRLIFEIQPVEVSYVAGYQAKLPCDLTPSAKDEEAIMLLWYKSEIEGSPIYSVDGRSKPLGQGRQWSDPNALADRARMRLTGQHADLEIEGLTPADAGLYHCRIDFPNNPTRNQKINLTVIVPPQSPEIYTNDHTLAKNLQPLNEDSSLMLVCEVTGGSPPPRVTWHWNGKLLDETFVHEYEELTVNRLDMDCVTRDLLSAQLVCMASNTHLIEPATAEIIIDVNLKPLMVNITNKAFHLSALRTYEIECISSGSRPEVVITWWKGTHQIKHMARNFAEGSNMTRSVMSYVPTIEDDGKFLTCRAENPVVSDSALEDRWHLIIHYVPVVTIKLGSSLRATDINEGDDVYFECEVKANPKAYKLAWFKDGKELHHNASANVILPGGHSLVLQSVTRSSAGEYSCMAANYEGKTTSRPVTLDIMYAPVCKDGTTAQVVGALKHETISLVCGVQSKPPPLTFQWTFNNSGELMNVPASRYAQVKPQHLITNHWHGSRLNYTPAGDMDYGTMACLATNQIGAQKVPCLFQIIVAGKPYPLQNCSALQSTGPYAYRMGHEDFKATDAKDADWLIVRCNEGFDGGLPITSFELEVYSDESVYHVNTIYINHTDKAGAFGPIFEVPGLEPGRNYRLLLYAVNAKGRSDPVVLEPVTLKGVAMYTTGRDSSEDAMDYSLLVACFAGGITAICILIVGVTLTLYRRSHPLQPSKMQTQVVHYVGTGADDRSASATVRHEDRQRTQQQQQQQQQQQEHHHYHHHHHHHQAQTQLTEYPAAAGQEYEQRRIDAPKNLQAGTAIVASMLPENPRAPTGQNDEDPDVIPPNKAERRLNVFEPNYVPKPERMKDSQRQIRGADDLGRHHQLAGVSTRHQQLLHPLEKDSWLRQNGGYQLVDNGRSQVDKIQACSPTRPSTLPVHRTHDIYTRSLRVQESCI